MKLPNLTVLTSVLCDLVVPAFWGMHFFLKADVLTYAHKINLSRQQGNIGMATLIWTVLSWQSQKVNSFPQAENARQSKFPLEGSKTEEEAKFYLFFLPLHFC